MSKLLSTEAIRNQSKAVFRQFRDLWIENAKENSRIEGRRNSAELEHMGIGKCAVLVAMGSSLENSVEEIKKYRDRIDVICCDKAFMPLLDHGIKADLVIVADAGIPFEYMEKSWRETTGVKLVSTPYANPVWTKMWRGPKYFYINQDAIETESIFSVIMGKDTRIIPAGSNVSNAMISFLTDCGGQKNSNWGGYERYYLTGYDYSWQSKGNYYAWNDPKPKRFYMTHRTMLGFNGDVIHTSENLLFSAKWLISYITTFDLPIINCSEQGLLDIPLKGNLERELNKINPNPWMQRSIKDAYHSWKDTHYAAKRCENNFNSLREVLICQ